MSLAPSQVFGVLDRLRRTSSGAQPSDPQFLAAYQLVGGLAGTDEWPAEAEDWTALLAPILCSSPEEQQRFAHEFETLKRRATAGKTKVAPPVVETVKRQPARLAAAVTAALAALLVMGVVWVYPQIPPLHNAPTRPTPTDPTCYDCENRPPILPPNYAIQLTVTDPKGTPLNGALLHYLGQFPQTRPDGTAEADFRPVPGSHWLMVTHPDYQTKVEQIAAGTKGPLQIRLTLGIASQIQPGFLDRYGRALWAAVMSVAAVLLWIVIRFLRRRLAIRNAAPPTVAKEEIGLDSDVAELFQPTDIRQLAVALRRRRPEESSKLSIPATVEATARAAGMFTPVPAVRLIEPEYLAILEQNTPRDHLPRYQDELFHRLVRHDVAIRRYYYLNDPEICFDAAGQVTSLRQLAALYPNHDLWVSRDAKKCANPVTGRLMAWTQVLDFWPSRVLLSPSAVEPDLASAMDVVAAAPTLIGFDSLFSDHPATPHEASLHPIFTDHPEDWLEESDPGGNRFTELYPYLRHYLGADGYLCLQACAVYPQTAWNLTASIVAELAPERQEGILGRLSLLPWFRHGFLPEWLRIGLVRGLGHNRGRVDAWLANYLATEVTAGGNKEAFGILPSGSSETWLTDPKSDSIYSRFVSPRDWGKLLWHQLLRRSLVGGLAAAAMATAVFLAVARSSTPPTRQEPPLVCPTGKFASTVCAVARSMSSVSSTDALAAWSQSSDIASDILDVVNPLPGTAKPATFLETARSMTAAKVSPSQISTGFVVAGAAGGGLTRSVEGTSIRLFGTSRTLTKTDIDTVLDLAKLPLKPRPHDTLITRVNPIDGQTYVFIQPGTFMMGCSPGDTECYGFEKPRHQVTLTKGFWMGQTPVTQEAYQRVVGSNPSSFKGARLPVANVSWDDARHYCSAVGMRLPTEAEFEYAARAGTTGARYGELDAIAWHDGNSGNKTHPVGTKLPNAWGLFDMLGNVWEWTNDNWADNYGGGGAMTDPKGPKSGTERVLRGGSCYDFPSYLRASVRDVGGPARRGDVFGARCAGE